MNEYSTNESLTPGRPERDLEHPLVVGVQILDHDAWMGGTIYVRNLIYALDAVDPAERPSVQLIGWEHARETLVNELASFDFVETPKSRTTLTSRAGRAARRLYRGVTGTPAPGPFDGVDILFPSLHTEASGNAKQLFWIPDFQHEHMPELFSADDLAARRAKDAAIADAGGHLVLSSHMALDDFRRFYPGSRTVPHVWSFCTTLTEHERNGRDPQDVYGLPGKYLYIPNQFWAHKNHMTAFQAIRALSDKGIEIDVVCTGYEADSRNRDHVTGLKRFIAEAGLTERVRFLGLVPRNDQIEIFRHAAAVLQPSLFEGWSTVVEDAKAVGRPVIASDFPVHKEQLGDSGHFFPGRDADALAALLEGLWPRLREGPDPTAEDGAAAAGMRRRAEAARAFLDIARQMRVPAVAP